MKIFSSTTGKSYEVEEVAHYRNMAQCAFMLSKADCELMDVFENNGKIVMCFPKWVHEKYIREWAERPRESRENNHGSE